MVWDDEDEINRLLSAGGADKWRWERIALVHSRNTEGWIGSWCGWTISILIKGPDDATVYATFVPADRRPGGRRSLWVTDRDLVQRLQNIIAALPKPT